MNSSANEIASNHTQMTHSIFGLVSLGLHCFLRLSSAGLIVVCNPGGCWALLWLCFLRVNTNYILQGRSCRQQAAPLQAPDLPSADLAIQDRARHRVHQNVPLLISLIQVWRSHVS